MSKLGCGEVIVGGEVRVGIGVGIISETMATVEMNATDLGEEQ